MAEINIEKCVTCPLGPPAWRYKCGGCDSELEMPAPNGPTDEKGRACPKCKSHSITRVDTVKSEACPPGG